jgi:hypothetical protein
MIHVRSQTLLQSMLGILLFLAFTLFAQPALACPAGFTVDPNTEGSGVEMCVNDSDPTDTILRSDYEEQVRNQNAYNMEEDPGNALIWFYYSMGLDRDGNRLSAGDTCISCDFITYFTNAIANFSASVYTFFQAFFVMLAPLLFAGWIAIQVIKLSVRGGEGGGQLFTDLIKKSALFFIAWGLLFDGFGLQGPVQNPTNGSTFYAGSAWQTAGPWLLEYSFDLNSDIRTQTTQGLVATNASPVDTTPFQCDALEDRVTTLVNNDVLNGPIHSITQTACVVERMHSLGMSTAIALILSAWGQSLDSGLAFLGSLVKAIWGVLLFGIYGLSAVWLIFLLLDVVSKALIVAAFLPLFGLAALFKPTRDVAQNALMQFVAVPVVAFALGLTNLLGFYLIMGTIQVYNSTYALMNQVYNDRVSQMQPINMSDPVEAFATFLFRIQLPSSDMTAIPTDITSPWLHYMLLVGLGIFTLGKKIVTIIENIMQVEGSSSMADNAKALAIKGGLVAMGAAGLVAKGGMMAAGAAGRATGVVAGGVTYGAGKAIGAMGSQGGRWNQFGGGVANMGGRMAKGSWESAKQKYSPFNNKGGQ